MPIPGFDGLERDADGNRFRWLPGIQVVGIGCYVTNRGRIDRGRVPRDEEAPTLPQIG
jgi:hypothetical protein